MGRLDEDFPTPPFEGFSRAALDFFTELAANQERAWFAEHKAEYERRVRDPLGMLVVALSERLAAAGSPLKGEPKKSIFRIHRDTRFSHDKRPYKTNGGAVWTRDGAKNSPGALYFHLDPLGCFAATGFYDPDAEQLGRLRRSLVAKPWAWGELITGLARHGLEISTTNKLTRAPKGFEAAPEEIHEALKLKSWVVMRPIEEAVVLSPRLLDVMADFARVTEPMLRLGWEVV